MQGKKHGSRGARRPRCIAAESGRRHFRSGFREERFVLSSELVADARHLLEELVVGQGVELVSQLAQPQVERVVQLVQSKLQWHRRVGLRVFVINHDRINGING